MECGQAPGLTCSDCVEVVKCGCACRDALSQLLAPVKLHLEELVVERCTDFLSMGIRHFLPLASLSRLKVIICVDICVNACERTVASNCRSAGMCCPVTRSGTDALLYLARALQVVICLTGLMWIRRC